jgi:hypothetical protein
VLPLFNGILFSTQKSDIVELIKNLTVEVFNNGPGATLTTYKKGRLLKITSQSWSTHMVRYSYSTSDPTSAYLLLMLFEGCANDEYDETGQLKVWVCACICERDLGWHILEVNLPPSSLCYYRSVAVVFIDSVFIVTSLQNPW